MNSKGRLVSSTLTIHTNNIEKMSIKSYVKESNNELVHKVSWPTWKELQSSAIIVMIASIIIALVIFLVDLIFENLLTFIYSLFY